ncbi:MAG: cob(I)yrinic acid a,c-diamide adenosyltransferase [Alphaproteobacteria bacterium]|nr:cob(I)yrinic acid a,c-diamide adenosyltransferase [Alphaproteobacteria bacterium]
MVLLTRIYTRSGDKGKTSLGNGSRLPKHHLRFKAIGEVDETNAALGLVRLYVDEILDQRLAGIQNDLFDVGADLCMPDDTQPRLRVSATQVEQLEKDIDYFNQDLQPLTSFILPGGTIASSYLHLARTITRRAERRVSELAGHERINLEVLRYLNRLSDLLFVLSRYMNDKGASDVLWKPAENQKVKN